MPRMGGLADSTMYGFEPPIEEAPQVRREDMPLYVQQAAEAPLGYEPNIGMFPTPRPPAPPAEPQERSYMPFSHWRALPPKPTAGTVMGSLAAPGGALDVSLMMPGPNWLRGAAALIGGSIEPNEAQAALRIKGGGKQPPMGSILSGMKISSGPPRGVLSLEEFESAMSPMSKQVQEALRPNVYADPKLREKAEKIWGTYPQYAEQYPGVGPPALKEKVPDPKNPGKYLIAPKKGEIPYASMEEALARAEDPGYFLEKKLTPEAAKFQNQRNMVQREMDKHGYEKYFDPAKRADIPASDYGPFVDTGVAAAPKTAVTDAKFMEKYGTPEARARLQEGYEKGQSMPNAEKWYFMKQLQDKYVDVLGPVAGKEAFKKEFSGMMAATTGGASPYDNWLMSHYAGYLNKQGLRVDQRAYEMPFPIGGRFASGNMKQAQKYIDEGMVGFDPAKNPKRYDFDNALAGDPNAGVIDEQMSGAFLPGMTIPEWYGPATRILREEAAKIGADPRAFQDVGWAGLKALKTEAKAAAAAAKRSKPGIGHNSEPFQFEYEGPMIDQINRSIETTHRLTGMPIEEIVTRGVIKKEIPMYGIGGAAAMGALARQDKRED